MAGRWVYMRVPYADGSEDCFKFDSALDAMRWAEQNGLQVFMLTNYPELTEESYEHIIFQPVPLDKMEIH